MTLTLRYKLETKIVSYSGSTISNSGFNHRHKDHLRLTLFCSISHQTEVLVGVVALKSGSRLPRPNFKMKLRI